MRGNGVMALDHSQSLDGVPLLAPLTAAARDDLARQCRWKRYEPGEVIIDSQGQSREVYFITQGTVRVVNFSISGREITLAEVGAGHFFGELAAVDGGPRSASVVASGPKTTAAIMPGDVFLGLCTRSPEIGLQIMIRLARMVRQNNERIMDLSTLGANNRVVAELLRLALAVSKDGISAEIRPIPVHSDLASRVSTTRETVARVFSDLSRRKIIERKKDVLVVHDLDQLALMVEDVKG